MPTLRSKLIRLAHDNPDLRGDLLPLLTASRIRYVVVDEKTLGALVGQDIQVLATRASHIDSPGIMPLPMRKDRMRDATPEDFKRFRVALPPELRG